MQILARKTNFDFMGMRWYAFLLTFILLLGSFYVWFDRGDSKYGVDFRGGNEVLVRFKNSVDVGDLRKSLAQANFKDVIVQNFENSQTEFSIRYRGEAGVDYSSALNTVFSAVQGNSYELLRQEFVGPVIGDQIRKDAVIAFWVTLAGIWLYVAVRFDSIFAMGALVSLFHDAIIAVGATILMGKDIGAGTLAAVLTIVGYSVNDTVIVFDRIRENLVLATKSGSAGKKGEAGKVSKLDIGQIINLSINETLARTLVTSFTVIIVCLILWLVGGGAVSDLSFTLLVGVVTGTYSSIFIASPMIVMFPGRSARGEQKEPAKA